MKLSICIPTHHGRRDTLKFLLETIVNDVYEYKLESLVQICISDNASTDGTEDLVKSFCNAHAIKIKYYRQSSNTGIKNFFKVIDLADTEYCWLIGSDDAIIPNGINNVLQCLVSHPDAPGVTVNKLNFDRSLSRMVGPDHDLVLPPKPNNTRYLIGEREILDSLFLAFCYISSHIFQKKVWDSVIAQQGIKRILSYPVFPHVFIFSEIAKAEKKWVWVKDHCVIQRLENFSFVTEVSSKRIDFAEQVTADLVRIALDVFGGKDDIYSRIIFKVFLIYWNPWFTLNYIVQPGVNVEIIKNARNNCVMWFGDSMLFRLTTYPIFLIPKKILSFMSKLMLKFRDFIKFNCGNRIILAPMSRFVHIVLQFFGFERWEKTSRDDINKASDSFLKVKLQIASRYLK